MLVAAVALLAAGCQQGMSASDSPRQAAGEAAVDRPDWQALSEFRPIPAAPAGSRYQTTGVGKGHVSEGPGVAPDKFPVTVYVHDMPGFPLPMFNDPV